MFGAVDNVEAEVPVRIRSGMQKRRGRLRQYAFGIGKERDPEFSCTCRVLTECVSFF